MHRRNASSTTLSRSLKRATFHLTDWRLSRPTEQPGDLIVLKEYHILKLNTIELRLSDTITDTSMPQRPSHFKIPLTSVHFVAGNATHELASPATVKPTFNDEEEDVVIRNGRNPEEGRKTSKPNSINV